MKKQLHLIISCLVLTSFLYAQNEDTTGLKLLGNQGYALKIKGRFHKGNENGIIKEYHEQAYPKALYGTYISYTFGCCFSCNCGTKYILTLNKDGTYELEQFKYTSPIKGKWWKYTLNEYAKEHKNWTLRNDTLIFPEENLIDRRLLFKDEKLIRTSDYLMIQIHGKDWIESDPLIKRRQFKKKTMFFTHNQRIKKHIRHRG